MRLTFEFRSDNNIILPVNYNEILQGFIYHFLSEKFGDFLHDHGYTTDNKTFKLFTFSKITSPNYFQFNRSNKTISFNKVIHFTLSTMIDQILTELVMNQMKETFLYLGKNKVTLGEIRIHQLKQFTTHTKLKMISPLVIHRTDFDKKTEYLTPVDTDFQQLLVNNLINKVKAYAQVKPHFLSDLISGDFEFSFKPIDFHPEKNKKVTRYKKHYITGYTGIFELSAPPGLIDFAYHCGIGTKNSMGFGCWEVY